MAAKNMDGARRGAGDDPGYVPRLPERVGHFRSLDALFEAMRDCTRCPLAEARTQVVPGVGPADAPVLFVGEAPGAREDRLGRPFVGAGGKLFDGLLAEVGLDRSAVFITNTVACRPPKNRDPRVREVRAHEPWLEDQIRLVAPHLLVTLGRIALTYFIPGAKITQLRGVPQSVERGGRTLPLLPLLHPAAVLRNPRALMPGMREDFRRIPELLGKGRGKGRG